MGSRAMRRGPAMIMMLVEGRLDRNSAFLLARRMTRIC